jgi:hypothetical protein
VLSREGRRYREEVRAAVPEGPTPREGRGEGPRGGPRAGPRAGPLTGPLELDVLLFPPDHRRRDLDNPLKAILDALEHAGLYADDAQVARL